MRWAAVLAAVVAISLCGASPFAEVRAVPEPSTQAPPKSRGTEDAPVVAKIAQSPRSAADVDAEAREAQRKINTDLSMLITNIALAAFAFLQLIVTGITLRGLRHAESAAKAAVKSADAAKQTVDTMMASERAYVFLHDTQNIQKDGEDFALIHWRNFGKTPALISKIAAHCGAFENPPDPRDTYALPVPAGAVIGAGEIWTRATIKLDKPRADLAAGRHVYLHGEITYRDIHGNERHSWFCRLYTGDKFILGIFADPKLNGYD